MLPTRQSYSEKCSFSANEMVPKTPNMFREEIQCMYVSPGMLMQVVLLLPWIVFLIWGVLVFVHVRVHAQMRMSV